MFTLLYDLVSNIDIINNIGTGTGRLVFFEGKKLLGKMVDIKGGADTCEVSQRPILILGKSSWTMKNVMVIMYLYILVIKTYMHKTRCFMFTLLYDLVSNIDIINNIGNKYE
jgi:hypothetical protein